MDVAAILKAFDHLEPPVRTMIAHGVAIDTVPEHAAVATVVSIGISLKRIADALEQMVPPQVNIVTPAVDLSPR